MSEQDMTKKRRVDNETKLNAGNDSGKYEVKAIWNSAVYARESELGHLPGLYYLVSWNGYPEEKSTWELASAVQHLKKLISLFHKNHCDKLTATSSAIDTTPPIAKPTAKSTEPTKRKQEQLIGHVKKRTKTH